MGMHNLLTSNKYGSLPAVSRSLIPRLQESDTNLDKYSLSMHGIKFESFAKFIFEWKNPFVCGFIHTICQFRQHITSHVMFGITYSHYYLIGFYTSRCNHSYGLIIYGWGKITYPCHLYFITKFVLYVLFRASCVFHIFFVFFVWQSLLEANAICWRNRYEIKFILSYIVDMWYHFISQQIGWWFHEGLSDSKEVFIKFSILY